MKWKEEKKRVDFETKRNKEDQSRNDPLLEKMILGLITFKHSLGLLIFSFGTPNPGLHYVL